MTPENHPLEPLRLLHITRTEFELLQRIHEVYQICRGPLSVSGLIAGREPATPIYRALRRLVQLALVNVQPQWGVPNQVQPVPALAVFCIVGEDETDSLQNGG